MKRNCGDIIDITDSSKIQPHFLLDLNKILWFVDCASLYNLFQMKLTRCTLLLSIFISTSIHVSGNYVPIIRTYCTYATLVFFTVYGWLFGLQTGSHPYRGKNTSVAWIL